MNLFSLNEIQWLILAISSSGIFFTIGKYRGISAAIDFFMNEDE